MNVGEVSNRIGIQRLEWEQLLGGKVSLGGVKKNENTEETIFLNWGLGGNGGGQTETLTKHGQNHLDIKKNNELLTKRYKPVGAALGGWKRSGVKRLR